ncbi:MAG: hypothetical protein ACKVRP_12845 [Bacteroidota bacterium]
MKSWLVLGMLLPVAIAYGGDDTPLQAKHLTGNLRVDFFGQYDLASGPRVSTQDAPLTEHSRKNAWLAGGLSLVVPGAGEFYAESYWKAAAFLAVEVAVWSIAYSYDKRGDRQTDVFQDYANQHWDVRNYAQWTFDNWTNIKPGMTQSERDQYSNMFLPDGSISWTRLNEFERALGEWYSHTLPAYGAQQYFELIGKYQQFYHGWDQARPELGTYQAISAYLDATPDAQFLWYSRERGKANDYYSTASTMVTIAVVNHIVSAVDAALTANSFNKHVDAQMGMQSVPLGDRVVQVPVAKLKYTF